MLICTVHRCSCDECCHSFSYSRFSRGCCYPHNLSSLQTSAIVSCATDIPSPGQRHGEIQSLGRLDSNKQRKSLLGPGSPLWNETIHRQKKHFSILLCTHITLQTWWPFSPLGPSPAPAPGSCVCKGEKWSPAHVNWQCISAWHDWKQPQQQLPTAASLQIWKKILFSSVLPYRPNWLKEVPKEHLESRFCKSHVRDRKGHTTPCLSRLFRRNNSNCDFDFHSWGAASPLQAGAQPVCNWTM